MRKRNLELFFYWMNERHRIYLKRKHGEPPPWTKDSILQEYKFTNVFRQLDRVTLELNAMLRPYQPGMPDDLLFANIATFRMFNWPPTFKTLVGDARYLKRWDEHTQKRRLHAMAKAKQKVFTGAYIITNAGSEKPKIDVVCEAVTKLWRGRDHIVSHIRAENTLETAVDVLSEYPLIGKFVAYEIACDLRWAPILKKAKDIYTWANPGPGAKRGARRIWTGDPHGRLPISDLEAMRVLREIADEYLEEHVPRPIEMRDIEHSLCEFDKYMRVKNGEGRPRSKFNPNPQGLLDGRKMRRV